MNLNELNSFMNAMNNPVEAAVKYLQGGGEFDDDGKIREAERCLNILQEDEPEVMILDLKMPGIDGIEVLRTVKSTRPEVEVIILTGHGSEEDRKLCLSLGAFAYLQKPVDIDVLTRTLRQANEKMRQNVGK